MEVTWVLYEFASQVSLFTSQLSYIWQTGHELSRAPRTCKRMYGKQGGHVGASNTLLNDAVYGKAFVIPKFILL